MATRDSNWPEGTPAWTDLTVPDAATTRAFYTDLFGWDFVVGDAEMGFYSSATLDGRTVAGIGQTMPGMGEGPPTWITYLAADDIAAVAERATAAGATAVMPPMQIMDFGHMALLADPTGGMFGLWQGLSHTGAQRVNEPGTMVWNETASPDFDAAKSFYSSMFHYSFMDLSGDGFQYAGIEVDEKVVGGLGGVGTDGTPGWLTYFAVADADAAVARVQGLGGQLLDEPRDSPYGRMAVVAGSAGERFAVITPT